MTWRVDVVLLIYEVVIGPAGSRAMVRVSYGQGQCQNPHVCALPTQHVLPAGPLSMFFSLIWCDEANSNLYLTS